MGQLCTMDNTGDTKVSWDKDVPAEVKVARDIFGKMKKQSYAAYKTDGRGGKGEVIHEFDPEVEEIVMMKPLVGG